MPRTIRAQLAVSYALVALLSVLAVGVVALSLLRRHVVMQEQQLLDTGAEALAAQLGPLVMDGAAAERTHRLVSSAAFLSGARVRVLGRQHELLVDSGSSPADADFVWFVNDLAAAERGSLDLQPAIGSSGAFEAPFVVALTSSATETLGAGAGLKFEAFKRHAATHGAEKRLDLLLAEPPIVDRGLVDGAVLKTAPPADLAAARAEPGQAAGAQGGDVMVLRRYPAPFGEQFVYQVEPFDPNLAAPGWRHKWRTVGAAKGAAAGPAATGARSRFNVAVSGQAEETLPERSGLKVAITASLRSGEPAAKLSFTGSSSPGTRGAAVSDAAPPARDDSPFVQRVLAGERVAVAAIGPVGAPRGYVEFRRNLALGGEGLAAAVHAFGWAALGAMFLAMLVAVVVSRSLTAPLADLAAAAGQMQAGNLSARAPLGGSAEVAAMAGQFNAMADQLEANFGAIAADRDALRRFIADASHELRTPITALKTFNSLLERDATLQVPESAEFVTESGAQIARLEWLTQNLLDLSRLESGLVPADAQPVAVADLLAGAVGDQRLLAEARGVTVEILPPAEGLSVAGDRRWLELAFGNLVNNAVKFTPAGGRVEVGAELLADQSDRVRLWVSDEGPGVQADEAERIFDRFYRGQAAAGGAVSGSGLGLAIVRGVAEAHGGRAWVDPAGEVGSRFSMSLPRG